MNLTESRVSKLPAISSFIKAYSPIVVGVLWVFRVCCKIMGAEICLDESKAKGPVIHSIIINHIKNIKSFELLFSDIFRDLGCPIFREFISESSDRNELVP